MKTTVEYLDDVKAILELPSDYAVATALGCTRAAISRYRLGQSHFDDATCARVAEILGIETLEVLAAAHAERARDDVSRRIWEGVWGKVTGVTATTVLAVGVSLAAAPSVAESSTIQPIVAGLHVM
ncbi:DUF3693 domain-containing protein [Burkholderia cepacia]|uniref:DUF3693 domain-containing protein n=1 Tax=Burkholderia cepacia TaxID=292 RepID=UPI00075EC7FB|nr:DUF3693 domain-containing protein [Burkholderia cepacia]KWH51821.1 hypothetical protein WM00_02670 [Burkholderia cepacia]